MSKLKENIDRILGSSLRCLLPSYWWKRIFGLLVEEIEDVKSTANSKATKSEVASLSNSVDALSDKVDNIDSGNKIVIDSALSLGSTNPVQNKVVTNELNAIYPVFRIRNTKDSGFAAYLAAAHKVFQNTDKTNKFPIAIVGKDSGDAICDALVNTYGNEAGLEFNVRNKRYRWVFNLEGGSTDYGAFIREEEVSSGSSNGQPIYIPLGDAVLTAEQLATNKSAREGYTEIPYAVYVVNANGQAYTIKYPIAQWSGDTFYVTDWDSGNPNSLAKYTINSDGSVTYNELINFATRKAVWIPAQGYASNTISKNIGISFNLDDIPIINEYNGNSWSPTSIVPIYARGTTIRFIREDELIQFKWESATGAYELTSLGRITSDTEMSDTSTNPVQNKVIKAYVDTEVAKKVDKVSGKGLSTEDFTTLLKTKLEGLENYDDTTLTNAISSLETRLNTLVSGDTSTAIESFNEVVAFLESLTDTQDLSSIIASIEQQINAKQDKINDLEDIRSGASLGKTSLQEHQDISHLATKEELQNVVDDILENEEVYAAAVNDLNNRVTTTDALLATETTNREALQTEVQTINTNILDNEEVIAATLVDINTKIDSNYQYGEITYSTKDFLSTEIQTVNTSILDNEEIIAATLTNLNSQIASLNGLIAELTTRIETLENA